MTRKNKKPRSIRRNRRAAIVAAVLALGMLLSSVAMYLAHIHGGGRAGPQQGIDLHTYAAQLERNIENLEVYLREHGPTVSVLSSLAENYYGMSTIKQMLGDETAANDYLVLAAGAFSQLVTLEPDNPRYRLNLLYLYHRLGEGEEVILKQVSELQDLLRATPQPQYAFSLIDFLQAAGYEQPAAAETAWLREHLELKLAEGGMDNDDRFVYAVLLAEYAQEVESALEQLDLILAGEKEESELYQRASRYRDSLVAAGDSSPEER